MTPAGQKTCGSLFFDGVSISDPPGWVRNLSRLAAPSRHRQQFAPPNRDGFASESDPTTAVCMLPGTELAFVDNVRYDNRWIWPKTLDFRVGKFGQVDPHIPDRHHDAVEFHDGSYVLVTQLCEGQRVTVLQLPVREGQQEAKKTDSELPAPRPIVAG